MTQNADSVRYVVRMRPDGWAVVDTCGGQLERRHKAKASAMREARDLNDLDSNGRTYAVLWYVEVEAVSEEQAVAKSRRYLAPGYRENWEPHSVEVIEDTQIDNSEES